MEKLKVGDKLYHIEHSQWGNGRNYLFATVERLIKTQAILSDGTKLINEPSYDSWSDKIGYPAYGDRWKKWHFETEEAIKEAEVEKKRKRISNWISKFMSTRFNDFEKELIYEAVKSLPLPNLIFEK